MRSDVVCIILTVTITVVVLLNMSKQIERFGESATTVSLTTQNRHSQLTTPCVHINMSSKFIENCKLSTADVADEHHETDQPCYLPVFGSDSWLSFSFGVAPNKSILKQEIVTFE